MRPTGPQVLSPRYCLFCQVKEEEEPEERELNSDSESLNASRTRRRRPGLETQRARDGGGKADSPSGGSRRGLQVMLHCLCCVTALKGEHAPHRGAPDCSGVIEQLPGGSPRSRPTQAATLPIFYLRQAADGGARVLLSLEPKQAAPAGGGRPSPLLRRLQTPASDSGADL